MWRRLRSAHLGKVPIFDQPHYGELDRARGEVVSRLLAELKPMLNLQTAVDVGCGLGYFSGFLRSLGMQVTAVDGREENVEETQRRNPSIKVHCYNAEDSGLRTLGRFDLVFCFGLLYHLENPLLAIRNLQAMMGKLLLVEGVIFPGSDPVMALIDEEIHEDQGLNHIAFYPTEACLVKMLYRSGFSSVLRLVQQPAHSHYHSAGGVRRVRTILAAAHGSIDSAQLAQVAEISSPIRPWDPVSGIRQGDPVQKLRRFAEKSLPEKVKSLKRIIKAG
jgi:2-polyprenyl-3-methyl-5-hydroxy-6-metoxy-1,4-benzoquinol methylase